MRKLVITFGLISGAISSVMMWSFVPFADRIGFDRSEIIGYTTIVLSMLMVFFGVRSYRDNIAGGTITFVRAFGVGLLITTISCLCYVVSWEILYFNFIPDFLDKYAAYMKARATASGASPEAIRAQMEEMRNLQVLYQNPLYNFAITFIEPFPVGLVITGLSAAILRKQSR